MPPTSFTSSENSERENIPLTALLVLPVPGKRSGRTLLSGLLYDLSWLMPVLAIALGVLLLRGTTPSLGIVFLFNGSLCLLLRIRASIAAWREQREINSLMEWQRQCREIFFRLQRN